MALLEIQNLTVEFPTTRGLFRAVDGIDMTLEEGDLLGVVGESGSGKSVTMLAVMGLLPDTAQVRAERLEFDGKSLLGLAPAERREITGKDMAMIFQEPMTSLNPCFTIGFQIMESLKVHEGGSRAWRRERAVELLTHVGIPAPETRLARLRQLGPLTDDNLLIFRDRTPKGRHYTERPGDPLTGLQDSSFGAGCFGNAKSS